MNPIAQMQAVADKLMGGPGVTLPPEYDLDEPWRTIYARVRRAGDRTEAQQLLWAAIRDLPNGERYAYEVQDLLPGDDAFARYPSLLEMDKRFSEVKWLWPRWIPRGVVTLLGAAPGAGKSLIALDLARRIVHGHPFPDEALMTCPGRKVLIVDAEGAPAILVERARDWDVDRSRLFLMDPGPAVGRIDLESPEQQELLRQMCYNLLPALVVVDSLAAAAPHGEASLEGAQALLTFLSGLAQQYDTAVLVIHHLRKRARSGAVAALRPAADDLRGSSHLSAAARAVLTLSLGTTLSGDLDFNGPRRLEVVKTNLSRYPSPLTLVFEGGADQTPTLHYSPWIEPPRPPSQVELCARWLVDFLAEAGQPVRPRDVVAAAANDGFSKSAVYRARLGLGDAVVDVGGGRFDSGKRWGLAADETRADGGVGMPGAPDPPSVPADVPSALNDGPASRGEGGP